MKLRIRYGVVDLQLGDAVGELERAGRPRATTIGTCWPIRRSVFCSPSISRGRRVADQPDLVAGPQAARLGAAAGVDVFDDDDAAAAREA